MVKTIKDNSTIIIHLDIKNLLYILGVLIGVYTTGFYFLNAKLEEVNTTIEKIKVEDIESLKTSAGKTDGQLQILIKYIDDKNKE